jgi:hypothetical protein
MTGTSDVSEHGDGGAFLIWVGTDLHACAVTLSLDAFCLCVIDVILRRHFDVRGQPPDQVRKGVHEGLYAQTSPPGAPSRRSPICSRRLKHNTIAIYYIFNILNN